MTTGQLLRRLLRERLQVATTNARYVLCASLATALAELELDDAIAAGALAAEAVVRGVPADSAAAARGGDPDALDRLIAMANSQPEGMTDAEVVDAFDRMAERLRSRGVPSLPLTDQQLQARADRARNNATLTGPGAPLPPDFGHWVAESRKNRCVYCGVETAVFNGVLEHVDGDGGRLPVGHLPWLTTPFRVPTPVDPDASMEAHYDADMVRPRTPGDDHPLNMPAADDHPLNTWSPPIIATMAADYEPKFDGFLAERERAFADAEREIMESASLSPAEQNARLEQRLEAVDRALAAGDAAAEDQDQ